MATVPNTNNKTGYKAGKEKYFIISLFTYYIIF